MPVDIHSGTRLSLSLSLSLLFVLCSAEENERKKALKKEASADNKKPNSQRAAGDDSQESQPATPTQLSERGEYNSADDLRAVLQRFVT